MNEKLLEKLKQADFMKKIIDCSTNEEIKEVLEKEGVNATDEEISEMIDQISKIAEAISKIDEKDMDEISGGGGSSGVSNSGVSNSGVRYNLAWQIANIGSGIRRNSGIIGKNEEDYDLKEKAINKFASTLMQKSMEISAGMLGSAAAIGVIGAVAGGRIAYKKIRNWAINKYEVRKRDKMLDL